MNKHKFIWFIPIFFLFFLSSCFNVADYEVYLPPPVLSAPEPAFYRTVTAAVGNVELFRDLNFTNVAAREETLFFHVNDLFINNIYVNVGDMVQAGDIIADLDISDIERRLERSRRDEEFALLRLNQHEELHGHNMRRMLMGGRIDEAAYLERRRDLQIQLEILRIESEHLRNEKERRVLRAGMDGMVTSVMRYMEGDLSNKSQPVATISDQRQSVFMSNNIDAVAMLEKGSLHEIVVRREIFTAEVLDPEIMYVARNDPNEVYLAIIDENTPLFPVRASGMVRIVLDEAIDVVYVPSGAIHKIDGRIFVFVLEDGIRVLREVEIGLEGSTNTEIKNGLKPGEIVIIN